MLRLRRGGGLLHHPSALGTKSLVSAWILHCQSPTLESQSSTDWLLKRRQLFQCICLGEKMYWSIIQRERVWEREDMGERWLKNKCSRMGITLEPVEHTGKKWWEYFVLQDAILPLHQPLSPLPSSYLISYLASSLPLLPSFCISFFYFISSYTISNLHVSLPPVSFSKGA